MADLDMDLVELLEKIPPLLLACICVEIPALKRLRLINKEASRVMLLGVRSYTLAVTEADDRAQEMKVQELRFIGRLSLKSFTLCLELPGETKNEHVFGVV